MISLPLKDRKNSFSISNTDGSNNNYTESNSFHTLIFHGLKEDWMEKVYVYKFLSSKYIYHLPQTFQNMENLEKQILILEHNVR